MTNEQAYVVLENCASLLDSGTRFFTEDHTKQFHEAYELAMEALRKTERKKGKWMPDNNNYYEERYVCSACKRSFRVDTCMGKPLWDFCPNCGARMEED